MTNSHTRPSGIFSAAVKEVRKLRGWTQADLARRIGVDRSSVGKLESGDRGVSLDEALEYASALGVHPSRLIAPMDNSPVTLHAGAVVEGHIFRAWLASRAYTRPDDVAYFPAEVDADEWMTRCNTSIQVVVRTTQQLIDALESTIDPHSEVAEVARDRMRAANEALDDFARVFAQRNTTRTRAQQRVRKAA